MPTIVPLGEFSATALLAGLSSVTLPIGVLSGASTVMEKIAGGELS
jgi:hypothetical protein